MVVEKHSDDDYRCGPDESIIRLPLWEHVTEGLATYHWVTANKGKSSITKALIVGLICLVGGALVIYRFPPLRDTETGWEIMPRALAATAFLFYVAVVAISSSLWKLISARPQTPRSWITQAAGSRMQGKTLKSHNLALTKTMLCLIPGLFLVYLAASDNEQDLYHPPFALMIIGAAAILILVHQVLNIWLYGLGRLKLSVCPVYSGDEFDSQWVVPKKLLAKGKVHFCLRRIMMKSISHGSGLSNIFCQTYRHCRSVNIPSRVRSQKPSLSIKFEIPETGPATNLAYWQGTYWQMVITTVGDRQDDDRQGLLGRIRDFVSICNPLNYRRTFILPVKRKQNAE